MRFIGTLFFLCAMTFAGWGQHAIVGQAVSNVKILNSNDQPTIMPYFGEKVLVVLYTDPDVKDINDPLSAAIKTKRFSTDKYAGVGIANCKATWIPNSAIRMKARQKEKQFPSSIVLIDDNEKLKQAWGLADCDGKGVVLVIGKDKKIKFLHYVKSQDESSSIIPAAIKTIQEEIAK